MLSATELPGQGCPWCLSAAAPMLLLRESPSKSVHWPFKRNCLGLLKPLSHSATILACFYSQKSWGLLFLALEP